MKHQYYQMKIDFIRFDSAVGFGYQINRYLIFNGSDYQDKILISTKNFHCIFNAVDYIPRHNETVISDTVLTKLGNFCEKLGNFWQVSLIIPVSWEYYKHFSPYLH